MSSRLRIHDHTAYISPTSGIERSGRSDVRERYDVAREGSARLLAAILRYFEKRNSHAN